MKRCPGENRTGHIVISMVNLVHDLGPQDKILLSQQPRDGLPMKLKLKDGGKMRATKKERFITYILS